MENKVKAPKAFQRETTAMFIESASWNDHLLEYYRHVSIERFFADYIKDNKIFTTLDKEEVEGEFCVWGTIDELRELFIEVQRTLWYSGVLELVHREHAEYDLDECYDFLEETTWEMCPECEAEVELDMILKMQVCPSCGKPIAPCSICDMNFVNCTLCPIGCNS